MCNWQRVEVSLPPLTTSKPGDGSSDRVLVLDDGLVLIGYLIPVGNTTQWRESTNNATDPVLTNVTHWATVELPGE